MEQRTGSKLGKEYAKSTYCHPAYLTYMQSISCKMLGWMKHKLGSRLPGDILAEYLRNADNTTFMAENEEELKSLLMKVKEESEKKTGLKFNIQKMKIMASGPSTLWQIDGKTMETVTEFIFLGSRITADSDYSHKIKRYLLLGRKL